MILFSFSSASTKVPPTSRYVYDVSLFRDPMGVWRGKYKDGRAEEVQNWIKVSGLVQAVLAEIDALSHLHVRQQKESFISFGLADRHGKWISPAIVELAATLLINKGFSVSVNHRECGY